MPPSASTGRGRTWPTRCAARACRCSRSSRGGPVREFDLLGITLQAELTYSNVLETLDLAGIPLRAADRGDDDPIVMAGGPSRLQPGAARAVRRRVLHGRGRGGALAIVDVLEQVADRAASASPRSPGCPTCTCRRRGRHPVERAVYASFDISTQPRSRSCPTRRAIFSRASVEVMRGCTRGCRFCHAGTWYRPVRERPADDVVKAGLEQLGCTGYDELSLTSLATSDYTGVERGHRRDQAGTAVAAPVAAIQPGRHGPGGDERRRERAPGLDHAGAGGGHAAHARHHLQDDHRRDDRAARSRRPSRPATRRSRCTS